MSSTITLAAFRTDVRNRLNEAANSPMGEVPTGTGGAATVATDATIDALALDGARLIARTCYPLRGRFTFSAAANQRLVRFLDAAPDTGAVPATPTGAELWRVLLRGVRWGSTLLRHAAEWAIRDPEATASAPSLYYHQGEAVALYPVPTSSGTVALTGFYLPPAPASSGAMFPMLPDDVVRSVLEYYVCALIAAKAMDDANLAGRGPVWWSEFEAGRAKFYSQLAEDERAYLALPGAPG